MKNVLVLIGITAFLHHNASAQRPIETKYALKHIGEIVTVCDKVSSAKFVDRSNTIRLTFDEHDQKYLIIIIKRTNWNKFKDLTKIYYKGTNVCVTGKIIKYKGEPEIIVNDPSQLKVNLTDNIVPIPANKNSQF